MSVQLKLELDLAWQRKSFLNNYVSGTSNFPSVDSLAPENVQTRGKDHQEDNHDGPEDEGPGHEGDLLQVLVNQCAGHGR